MRQPVKGEEAVRPEPHKPHETALKDSERL